MQIMQDGDNGRTCALQTLGETEHLQLVIKIEIRRRFIKQQNLRRLRQGHRNPDTLTLATGEFANAPPHEGGDAGIFHRTGERFIVFTTPLTQKGLVGVASPRNQVLHEHIARSQGRLREQSEPARERLLIHVSNTAAVQLHHTATNVEHARQRPQESRLPARIGADDDGQFPSQHVQGQPIQNRSILPVADDDISGAQPRPRSHLSHDLTSRINSHRRYKPPTTPVTTPTGSSAGAIKR